MIFFLIHVLGSIKFTLIRWQIGHSQLSNILLITIGFLSFWAVPMIKIEAIDCLFIDLLIMIIDLLITTSLDAINHINSNLFTARN